MTEEEISKAIERTKEARRLGGYDRICIACGEPHTRCLELHHLAGRAYGDDLVPICRNCHRKVTDKEKNKPVLTYPSTLEQIGHWLQGLAEFLGELALKAFEFSRVLIDAAKHCPPPYGNLESEVAA